MFEYFLRIPSLLRNLFHWKTAEKVEASRKCHLKTTDDKVEAFTKWLLGDIYGCFAQNTGMDIEYIEPGDDRCVPGNFSISVISFSAVFIDELLSDMLNLPTLLFSSEYFFFKFTNKVFLKLIKGDPPTDFLKVVAFLMVIICMSFECRCYLFLNKIPWVFYDLLTDHLTTKFYEEGKFDDIEFLCENLEKDDEWCESAIEEIRGYIKDALETELGIRILDEANPADKSSISIKDVKSKRLTSDSKYCTFCGTNCIDLVQDFWKPTLDIAYPERIQS